MTDYEIKIRDLEFKLLKPLYFYFSHKIVGIHKMALKNYIKYISFCTPMQFPI